MAGNMAEAELLSLLAEAQVLSALHVAEAVKSKLEIIRGLQNRVQKKELENAVRNYIADNPWLLSPEWETFRVEKSVKTLVADSCKEAGFDSDESWQKRVDLVLSSGTEILAVEFMRPGLAVDRDHIDRFQCYIDILRSKITANTGLQLKNISGLLVADKLNQKLGIKEALKRMADDSMKALEWAVLFELASKQWAEFMEALVDRAPNDERLSKL